MSQKPFLSKSNLINPAIEAPQPYVRVTLGNDVFEVGDGKLKGVSVTLSEGRKSSGCEIYLKDADGAIANKYFQTSYAEGGLNLPSEFFENNTPPPDSTQTSEVDTTGGTVSKGGVFTPKIRAFLDLIAYKEVNSSDVLNITGYYTNNLAQGGGYFNDDDIKRGGGFPASAGKKYNVGRYQFNRLDWEDFTRFNFSIRGYSPSDQDKLAYEKLKYRRVIGPLSRDDLTGAINAASKEWASLPQTGKKRGEYGQANPNYTMEQAKDYYYQRLNYYQLKEQENKKVNQNTEPKTKTTDDPNYKNYTVKKVLKTFALVSFYGLNDGFDGKATASGEIFQANKSLTAAHKTLKFGTIVKVTWLANNKSVVVKINDRGPFVDNRELDISVLAARSLASEGFDSIQAGILNCKLEILEPGKDEAEKNESEESRKQAEESLNIAKSGYDGSLPEEIGYRGSQILVDMTFQNDEILTTSFFHSGTEFTGLHIGDLRISGQSIRFILNRRIKNTKYEKVSLKAIAQKICREYNLKLDMPEEGEQISVSQVALSDFRFLSLLCSQFGFSIQEVGNTLIIKRKNILQTDNENEIKGYILQAGINLIDYTVINQAQTEAIASNEQIATQAGIMKTTVDSDSGTFISRKEFLKGSGNDKTTYTTGKASPELELINQEGNVTENSLKRPEGKNVKEYVLTATILTTQETLKLNPDTPIYLEGVIEFARTRWFLESITHTFRNGFITSTINAYIPIEPKIRKESEAQTQQSVDPIKGIGKRVFAYEIRNPKGGNVNRFEDLTRHWPGSGNYAEYKKAPNQVDKFESYIRGTENVVYDFTLYQNGSSNVSVPSPISGQILSVDKSYGAVRIQGTNFTVRILHMSNIVVKAQDRVSRGSYLGTQNRVDAGGASTGVHVHFEGPKNVLKSYIESLKSGNF